MNDHQILAAQDILETAVEESGENFITGALRDIGAAATMPLVHIGATTEQAVSFALEVAHMAAGAASEIHHEIGGVVVTAEDLGDDISIRFGGFEVTLLELDGTVIVDVEYDPGNVESVLNGLRLAKAA